MPAQYDYDFIVVGSGFGRSVFALRLARHEPHPAGGTAGVGRCGAGGSLEPDGVQPREAA